MAGRPATPAYWAAAGLAAVLCASGCTIDFDRFDIANGNAGGSAGAAGALDGGGDVGRSGTAGSGGSAGGRLDASLDVRDSAADQVQEEPPDSPEDVVSDVPIEGDGGCAPGTKPCGSACVVDDDPAYGCASDGCNPCDLANAAATCNAGACAIEACNTGYSDCNVNPVDGCERHTDSDSSHCGSCGNPCILPNAVAACISGRCTVDRCSIGYDDCNGDPLDGCEVNIQADPANCSGCGLECQPLGGTICNSGSCQLSPCPPGTGNCDGDGANGCEAQLTSDPSNCGYCGNVCDLANATGECRSGSCAVATCNADHDDCDGVALNGCETDVTSSSVHCGQCGGACSTLNNGSRSCTDSVCSYVCNAGFADCNGPQDGTTDDGCEVDTSSSNADCGGCGVACTNPNGLTSCVLGVCSPVCNPFFGDCNGDPTDGCEADLRSDPKNCAGCGIECTNPNGSTSCLAGTCVPSCDPGFGSCDANPANGCETNLDADPRSCGTCGHVCLPSGGSVCNGGVCEISTCPPGTGNCDGNDGNGCETNLNNSTANCGYCGNACSLPNATPKCVAGICGIDSCFPGSADCDGDDTNGCEVDLSSDVGNCGACGAACSTANSGASTCAGGQCSHTCTVGFEDCNGPRSGTTDDGCETNTGTSVANCGSCGMQCVNQNGSTACISGVCAPTCNPGRADCDGNPNNGCETNTDDSVTDCGACAAACTNPHGSTTCVAGTCSPSCTSGYADCDGNPANGCESGTQNDPANCGACGTVCSNSHGSTSCVSGKCAPICSSGFDDCNGNVDDGCETSITTTTDCGACNVTCSNSHGTTVCTFGLCDPTCDPGFDDCNGNANDGCETSITTTADCGACGVTCSNQHGSTACVGGACAPSCSSGFDDCDGNPDNGCETSITTTADCGACGVTCSNQHGSTACVGGACAPSCLPGFGDCNGNANDGCETDTNTSTADCGACGDPCSNPHGTTACVSGTCTPSCDAGYEDCDGDSRNGCETDLGTTTDCGACFVACSNPHGTTGCVGGVCSPTCDPGFDDCDSAPENGCETSTNGSTSNCGTCGTQCTNSHGSTACVGGVCTPSCDVGFDDCNGNPVDGCETNINTSAAHCGACLAACDGTNGTPACVGGSCQIACDPGFGNCDGDVSNGCESDLSADVDNCSGCGNQCTNGHGATACIAGSCSPTCDPGFDDCDGDTTNGCEADLSGDPANCGGCGIACGQNESCIGSVCQCDPGFADCDGSGLNGCEVVLASDVDHCGACNRPCSSNGVASRDCSSGICTSSCDIGRANCVQPTAPTADDGCERNVTSDDANCGGCSNDCTAVGLVCADSTTPDNRCGCGGNDNRCDAGGGSGYCSQVARPGACRCERGSGGSVFDDEQCAFGEVCVPDGNESTCSCNGGPSCSGGEICCQAPLGCRNVSSDPLSCGACGRACPPGFSCSSSQCRCTQPAQCDAGEPGGCDGNGRCICGGSTCGQGERCLPGGVCG